MTVKILKKDGHLTSAAKAVLRDLLIQHLLEAPEETKSFWERGRWLDRKLCRYHGVRQLGRGRFVSISYANESTAEALLAFFKVDYVTGNDAPRGGKTGSYLEYSRGQLEKAIYERMRF